MKNIFKPIFGISLIVLAACGSDPVDDVENHNPTPPPIINPINPQFGPDAPTFESITGINDQDLKVLNKYSNYIEKKFTTDIASRLGQFRKEMLNDNHKLLKCELIDIESISSYFGLSTVETEKALGEKLVLVHSDFQYFDSETLKISLPKQENNQIVYKCTAVEEAI